MAKNTRNYVSDIGNFLVNLKQENPQLEQSQREGRAILWEKCADLEQQEGFKKCRVAQRAYVYSND